MIYFDNAASTRPSSEVLETFTQTGLSFFANPSSGNVLGMEAEKVIKQSAEKIAKIINAQVPEEIIFTSGGTESNNIAICGVAKGYNRKGKHILTTSIEHPAVAEPLISLSHDGYEVEIIEVDEKGYVNLEKLKKSIRKDTILVSIILINNEIGTIQKVSQIGKIIKEINPETIFHVDGVQAFGKFRINVKESKIDLLSASGHKFHTPKGLGFLYIKKGLRVKPIMLGGGQQYGVRAGTENVAGAAALAHGAELAYNNFEDKINHVRMLKEKLQNGIFEIENTYLNGEVLENASPFVLNVRFEGLRSPILLNALEEKGIFVSAGSACSSKKKVQSSVLLAIGLSEEAVGSSIRFSFSSSNTVEEVEECIKALKEIVPILRRFNKKR